MQNVAPSHCSGDIVSEDRERGRLVYPMSLKSPLEVTRMLYTPARWCIVGVLFTLKVCSTLEDLLYSEKVVGSGRHL